MLRSSAPPRGAPGCLPKTVARGCATSRRGCRGGGSRKRCQSFLAGKEMLVPELVLQLRGKSRLAGGCCDAEDRGRGSLSPPGDTKDRLNTWRSSPPPSHHQDGPKRIPGERFLDASLGKGSSPSTSIPALSISLTSSPVPPGSHAPGRNSAALQGPSSPLTSSPIPLQRPCPICCWGKELGQGRALLAHPAGTHRGTPS